MKFRAWYESLRRHTDASSFYWEPPPKAIPRPIVERITCHTSQLAEVQQIVFEVNPWTEAVESSDFVQIGWVWVVWLTASRQQREERMEL